MARALEVTPLRRALGGRRSGGVPCVRRRVVGHGRRAHRRRRPVGPDARHSRHDRAVSRAAESPQVQVAFLATSVTIVRPAWCSRSSAGRRSSPPSAHSSTRRGRPRCARTRGRGRDREVDALGRRRRARPRARGLRSSRRGRPRPSAGSHTWGWAISSRTSSTTSCRRCRRRGGARSRSRSSERRRQATPSIPARSAVAVRDALQLLGERRPMLVAIDDVQWLDASSSGALGFALRTTRQRAASLLLLARRLVDGAQPSELERALERGARPAPAGWGRSASARSIGCCAIGSEGRSPARRCSASTSGRVGIRSSRSSWRAFSTWTSTRSSRWRFPRRSRSSCARGSRRLPAATREALALAAALGTPSESLLERAGVAADALDPAVAAHVIEREDGMIRFTHPLLSSVLYDDLGEPDDERARTDRRDRRRPAPARASPRALDRHAGRRRRRRARRRRRPAQPIAARRPSRPSSPSMRSG